MKHLIVVSDINANLKALKIFLKNIEQHFKFDYIINLGNFVADGPNPSEVFDLVLNDSRFINILGYREKMLIDRNFDEIDYDGEITHEAWVINSLGEDRIESLSKLPLSKSLKLYEKRFFCIHSDKINKSTYPTQHIANIIYNNELSDLSKEEKAIIISEHDYILTQDNFVQGLEVSCNKKYIKPGPLGWFNSEYIKFAVIEVNDFEDTVYFKSVKYDFLDNFEECLNKKVPSSSLLYYPKTYTNQFQVSNKEVCNVTLCSKSAPDTIAIDFSFYEPLMTMFLKNSDYIIISCWDKEKNIVKEILQNLNIISKETLNVGQIVFKVKNDCNLKNLLLKNFLNDKGLLKWFSLYAVNDATKYYIEHYGCEIYFNNISIDDVNYIKSIINNNTTMILNIN